MNIIPNIIQSTPNGERSFDIYSRLLDSNIIMIDGEINDQSASLAVAQLLYLDTKNTDKQNNISMYINSPGGSVSAGMSIIDTMHHIKTKVSTIVTGMAASMGAMLLLSGEKGMRYALPHSEIMIHQPLGGSQGQATDMIIAAEHIKRTKQVINQMIADATGKSLKDVVKATDRDNYMTADEALKFGLIDKII